MKALFIKTKASFIVYKRQKVSLALLKRSLPIIVQKLSTNDSTLTLYTHGAAV